MNWNIIWAIARKDLKEVLGNKAVWLPAVLVPLILVLVLPAAGILLPSYLPAESTNRLPPAVLEKLLHNVPVGFAALIRSLKPGQGMGLLMTGYVMAPIFLLIPLMLASIVGANAFVGEKERKTLEALLYTPATSQELLIGKILTAVLPAIAISWASFAAYAVVLNAAAWPFVGRIWFPLPTWWPLMFWVSPAIATLGMGFTVVVSARSNTYMEASQVSGLPVILLVGLMAGQATGVMFLGVGATFLVGTVLWLVDIGLLVLAARVVERHSLATRL